MHHYSAITLFFILLFNYQQSFSSEIFVFKDNNGHRVYTDQKIKGANLEYIRSYGRPPAYYQCHEVKQKERQLRPLFNLHARQIGFDSKLAMAVAYTESCFDRTAVSKVGAQGIMQLMPNTANHLGVTNAFNAKQNIKGGIKYLKQLFDLFDGNIKWMLAAYNAGPGNVKKYQGMPPFKETRRYVAKVIKKYQEYLDTEN